MMKKLLLALVAMMAATMNFAQNTVVATLSHGTDITVYYSVKALQQAVAQAESGDVINLSGGVFNAASIAKGITVRGAGIDSDNPTYVVGDFTIEIPTDDAKTFMMEGVRCQNTKTQKGAFKNPYFLKSQIQKIEGYDENDAIQNIMIVNCKVLGGIGLRGNSTLNLVNSYAGINYRNENATIMATNCFLSTYAGNGRFDYAQLYNCILSAPSGSPESGLSETCQAVNCVSTRLGGRYYTNIFPASCINCLYDIQGIIKDAETLELTDEAKTTYLGVDGTEVGMYGGLQPYNTTPSYPLITKMAVNKETDDEGKLGVTIEVK